MMITSRTFIYDDCCLLTNIDLNSERVYQLLERRFKSNANKTSFDFKSFLPEQPSNNAKVSRSLLRFIPNKDFNNAIEENVLSDSCSSEEEDNEEVVSTNDDDYLNELAEWEPENFQPVIENDDDDDDDGEDENENVIQSIDIDDNDEDNHTNQMDHSSGALTTQVEDLLVTFVHRPPKSEPISYDDDVFYNPPQLDGQIDFMSNKSSTQSKQNDKEKLLRNVIAKVKAKTPTPNKAIKLNQLPSTPSKFRLNDEIKKKPINQTPRKSFPTPPKINKTKQQSSREIKKCKPPLLTSVLKNNEDAIRPLYARMPSIQAKISKPTRTSSDSGPPSTTHKQQSQRKLSTNSFNEEQTSALQQMKSSSIDKQKSLPQNKRSVSKPIEKSASEHMTLAQQTLYHFQKKQQSISPLSKMSNSNNSIKSVSSSMKSKSKENDTNPTKTSKYIDLLAPKSTSKTPILNDHNQQIKKKKKKVKRLDSEHSNNQSRTKDNLFSKPKNQKSIKHFVTKKQPSSNHRTDSLIHLTSSDRKTNQRAANHFEGCILIDDDDDHHHSNENNKNDTEEDDDIQEIGRQRESIAYNIRTREKLLDHAIHSSVWRMKWLFNLEFLLLEHILICHKENIRPLNNSYPDSTVVKCEYPSNSSSYHIDPSFISTIIINFIKMFILRNSLDDQQELSFIQFGLTSHLRYLLVELPTYNHNEIKDFNDDCSQCSQYSLIINILFDFLFDLIEYDLCERNSKTKYRSSLIEDDYFNRFLQSKLTKKNQFYRIKLIIYFIELIGIHMNKCQKKKQFQFNKNENQLFHSIEDFIQHVVSQTNSSSNARISICFNVMELCLLFVDEKEIRIKQMALFLTKLCEDNLNCLNIFLFDKNLLPDIRLLLINELIWKKLHMKFYSINHVIEVFQKIQMMLNKSKPIDEFPLLLLRSLFNTYGDLIIEIKPIVFMYSNYSQQITSILRNQLESILGKLIEVSLNDSDYFNQIKRTLIFFRLLKCKWHKL